MFLTRSLVKCGADDIDSILEIKRFCSDFYRRGEKIQLGKDLVVHLFHTVVNISVVKPSSGHWVHADGGDDKNRMMFTNCSYSLSVYC